MKAEDLMIGDYCRVWREGLCIKNKGTVVKVLAIDAEKRLEEVGLVGCAHCHPLDGQFDGGIWCEYLDPVPLTAEILEKNGFKKTKYGHEWKEHIGGYMGQTTSSTTPIEIMYDEGHCVVSNPHIGRMFQGSVDSVHELQHVLRQCDISKDITL